MTSQVKIVGRYELLDPIGHGGMAVVYLARQTDLDRQVALKELRLFQSPDDPALAERFLREARMAGAMSHPNIVTVHEYFKHEGTPYIAMEYLQRGSLRPWVGSVNLAQIAGVLEGLLAALDHAERFRIVHRDLKPENLLVTDQGQVKVADFGIARARTMHTNAFLTKDGTTVGTPTYMAPEQAMAQELGPYTDLYSVGVMAYELLAGRVPFHDTDTPVAIILRHVNENIPPAYTVNPSVDRALSDWIDRLLIKDPEHRTQTAEQAWDELEEIILRLLGSRWRREARLLGSSEQPSVRPLTPAPFTSTATETPIPAAQDSEASADALLPEASSCEFVSYAGGAAKPAVPVATPPAAPKTSVEPAPEPEPSEPTPVPAQPAARAEPVRPAEPPRTPEPSVPASPARPSGFETFAPRGPQSEPRNVPPPVAAPPLAPPPPPPPPPPPRADPTPPPAASVTPPPAPKPVWATATDPAQFAVDAPTVMPDSLPKPVQPPAPSAPSPDVLRRRRIALIGAGAAAGVAAIAVAGVLVAGGGGASDGPQGPTFPLRSQDLAFNVPTTWRKSAVPDIPGLHARNAVAATAPGGASVLAAEHLAGSAHPTLLSPRLRAALRGRLPKPETVTLDGTQAYRYDALRVRGVPGRLRVYAMLTSDGVATVTCGTSASAAPAAASECDQIVRTLSLTSAEAQPIRVSDEYAALLEKAFATLNSGVNSVNTSLAGAGTASGRAAAMRDASRLYRVARASLAKAGGDLNPIDVGLNRDLAAMLKRFASAYSRVARATQSNKAAALRRARRLVGKMRPRLATVIAALRRLGYTAALPATPNTPQSPVASTPSLGPSSSEPPPAEPPAGPNATPPPGAAPPPPPPPPPPAEEEESTAG